MSKRNPGRRQTRHAKAADLFLPDEGSTTSKNKVDKGVKEKPLSKEISRAQSLRRHIQNIHNVNPQQQQELIRHQENSIAEVGDDDNIDDGKRKSSRHCQTIVKTRGTKKTRKRNLKGDLNLKSGLAGARNPVQQEARIVCQENGPAAEVVDGGRRKKQSSRAHETKMTTTKKTSGTNDSSTKNKKSNMITENEPPADPEGELKESERILKTAAKCEECGKMLSGRKHLRRHVLRIHKADKENGPAEVGGDGKRNAPRVSSATGTTKGFSPKRSLSGKRNRLSGLSTTNISISRPSRKPVKCLIEGCSLVLSKRSHLFRHIRNIHKIDPKTLFTDQENGPAEVMGDGGTSPFRLRLSTATATPTAGSSQSRTGVVRGKGDKSLNSRPSCIPVKCWVKGCDLVLSKRCHLFRHIRRTHKGEPLEISARVRRDNDNRDGSSRSRNGKRNDVIDSSSKNKSSDRKSISKPATPSRNPVKCPIIGCGLWLSRFHFFRHIRNTHGRTGGIPPDVVDQQILQRVVDSGSQKTRVAAKKVVSFVTRPFESTAKTRWALICPPQPKLFKCPIEVCGKRLSKHEHCMNHVKNVHKVDPYGLTMPDGKPFAVKKIRRSHPFLYTNSRSSVKCPFEFCGKTLSRPYNLVVHIKNVHKADPWNTFDIKQKMMRMRTTTPATRKSPRTRKSMEIENISTTSEDDSDS